MKDRMRLARVDEADVLSMARMLQGLERMERIRQAVLEHDGKISIIPGVAPLRRETGAPS